MVNTDVIENIMENIVSSYEDKIKNIESVFNSSNEIIENSRLEKETRELRNNLASNDSLRKADFDRMMDEIVTVQVEREREIKKLLSDYLNSQKQSATLLRQNLADFRDMIKKGDGNRIKEFQDLVKDISLKHEQRKSEVVAKLREFELQQKELSDRVKELLTKGKELRIIHFKAMLNEFKEKEKQRLDKNAERRQEVQKMLSEFRKDRIEGRLNLQKAREKIGGIKNGYSS